MIVFISVLSVFVWFLVATLLTYQEERAAMEGKVAEAQLVLENERQAMLISKSTADRDLKLAKQVRVT